MLVGFVVSQLGSSLQEPTRHAPLGAELHCVQRRVSVQRRVRNNFAASGSAAPGRFWSNTRPVQLYAEPVDAKTPYQLYADHVDPGCVTLLPGSVKMNAGNPCSSWFCGQRRSVDIGCLLILNAMRKGGPVSSDRTIAIDCCVLTKVGSSSLCDLTSPN